MTPSAAASTHVLNEHPRLFGYIALAVSIVGVGSALIFVRLSEVDPTATLMLRMAAASVMLSAIMAPRKQVTSWSNVSLRDLGLLVLSSVVSGLDLLANQWAVHYTSVANTALLINLSPVFVLLISWLVLRRSTSILRLVAVMFALCGGAIVIIGGGKLPSLPPNHMFGDALALLSAFLYAVYLLMTRDLRQRVPTFVVMLTNSVVIAAILLPVTLATSSPTLPRGLGGYAIIVTYALVSQLLGHGLLAYALRTIDADLASVSALLRPVVAMVLGWLVLAEGVGFLQIVGGAGILASLFWFQCLGRKPPERASI